MKMSQTRRKFMETSLKGGLTIPFLSTPLLVASESKVENSEKSDKKLNILILGGTSFLGPHQIAYALKRGHSITTFTRGKTKPTFHQDLFKNVEMLVGDREDNLKALEGRKWDAVIDNSGRRVKWTKDTAELLKDNVDLYLYTSSTGVYYPYLGDDIKEDTKLVRELPSSFNKEYEKMEYEYGIMKANSEKTAQDIFGKERTIIVRPTYMVGPADKLDRFIYWPIRLSQGGEILVPGKGDDPVQYIDVRDVAQWMIRLIEKSKAGVYNGVGPASKTGMHAFVYGAYAAFSVPVSFVMVDDYDFLNENNLPYLVPWIMPTGNNQGTALINNKHSLANGLTLTPLATTVKDTHDWWYSDALTEERRQKFEGNPRVLLNREKELIKAWKAFKK